MAGIRDMTAMGSRSSQALRLWLRAISISAIRVGLLLRLRPAAETVEVIGHDPRRRCSEAAFVGPRRQKRRQQVLAPAVHMLGDDLRADPTRVVLEQSRDERGERVAGAESASRASAGWATSWRGSDVRPATKSSSAGAASAAGRSQRESPRSRNGSFAPATSPTVAGYAARARPLVASPEALSQVRAIEPAHPLDQPRQFARDEVEMKRRQAHQSRVASSWCGPSNRAPPTRRR